MKNQDVHRRIQRMEYEFGLASAVDFGSPIMQLLAKYLCVSAAGLIERSAIDIFSALADQRSSKPVKRFVKKRLDRMTNLNTNNLLDLVGAFDKEWRNQLETKLDGAPKDGIDSLIANRHLIAHGRPVGVSIAQIKGYYEQSLVAIQFLDEVCN